jgi:Zn-finger protein
MNETIEIAKKVQKEDSSKFLFSICTLVTRKQEYDEMLNSFLKKGFTTDDCEYLYIDNSENSTYDAYEGLNVFLQKAQGKYVILCHQDILIHDNDKTDLLKLIEEVESKDPNWGILANAGGINLKWIATHITQGNGRVIKENHLPLKVKTVDENFIIVKKSANIALSRDLSGFHFYGTDICLIADVLGFNSYTIGFNIIHKSNGKPDASFHKLRKELKLKYRKAFRNRFLTTTFSRFFLSGTDFIYYFNDAKPVLFLVRQYYKFFTKKKDYKL